MQTGSFVRWQSTSIQQLGFSINLILALATGSLGYAFNLVRDSVFQTHCWSKALSTGSLFLLIASVSLGIWCTLNRSRDFKVTTRIARDREEFREEGKAKEEIDKRLSTDREESKRLGTRTLRLFYGQIAAFGIGILFLIIALGIVYHTKLF